MSAMKVIVVALCLTTLVAALMAASARTPRIPEDPRDVPREAQLTVTEARADLNGDGNQEVLLAVNALTGESDPARGSEVIFGVAAPAPAGERGQLLWSRHVMTETGQPAHDGELTAVDLDGDGRSELLITWDRSLSPNRVERWGELYTMADPTRPIRVWEGVWERDTRRDKDTPANAREWFRREFDFGATRKEAGKSVVFKKVQAFEGGQKIDPPRIQPEWVKTSLRAPAAP